MSRVLSLALGALLSSAIPAAAQDSPDPGMVPVPLYTSQNAPQGVDPLRQFAADVNARFIYGAQSRKTISDSVAALADRALTVEARATALEAKPDLIPRIVALEARPIVPDLTSRVTTLEGRAIVPDLTSRVSVLEAKSAVPDLTVRVTTLEARPVLTDRVMALEARPVVPDLTARVTTLEARPVLTDRVTALEERTIPPDLTTRVVTLEARPVVPDLTTRVTTLEARPNYTTATLATAGVIKANITQIARTTSPVVITLPSISVLGLSLLPSISVSVPGVQLGDFVQATFAAAPPAGVTITGAQATAAGTVLVTFQATQAMTLAVSTQSLNFVWTR